FTHPFREFERQWQTTEPVHSSDGLFVVGLNSVRPWRHQSGGLPSGQLRHAAELLAGAPEEALRVVALHHHLIGAPWRSRKKPVARRTHVLAALVDAGAELRRPAAARRPGSGRAPGRRRAPAAATAPAPGQPAPDRGGWPRGLPA